MTYNKDPKFKRPMTLDIIAERQNSIMKVIKEIRRDIREIHEHNTLIPLSQLAEKTGRDPDLVYRELSPVFPHIQADNGEHWFRVGDIRFYLKKHETGCG